MTNAHALLKYVLVRHDISEVKTTYLLRDICMIAKVCLVLSFFYKIPPSGTEPRVLDIVRHETTLKAKIGVNGQE